MSEHHNQTVAYDFNARKEAAASDCEQIAEEPKKLAASVRNGDMMAFEAFWISGGTEEGDAQIIAMREIIVLRYLHREEVSAATSKQS